MFLSVSQDFKENLLSNILGLSCFQLKLNKMSLFLFEIKEK